MKKEKNNIFQTKKVLVKGFTLIELLVVVSLIGVLATLVLANLNAARQRGRDAKRKSALRNVETALRLYYNDKGVYPTSNAGGEIVGCGIGGGVSCAWGEAWLADGITYMATLSEDPIDTQSYFYVRNDADSYLLQSCLENKSDNVGKTTADTGWCPSGWMYEVAQ